MLFVLLRFYWFFIPDVCLTNVSISVELPDIGFTKVLFGFVLPDIGFPMVSFSFSFRILVFLRFCLVLDSLSSLA